MIRSSELGSQLVWGANELLHVSLSINLVAREEAFAELEPCPAAREARWLFKIPRPPRSLGPWMTLLAIVKNETWRASLHAALSEPGRARFFTELPAAIDAHRSERATQIILELGAFPEFELCAFGGQDPPALLCLVENASEVSAALRAGATDCELAGDPSRLAMRLHVLQAQHERTRRVALDITGTVSATTSSLATEASVAALLNTLPIPVITLDGAGLVQAWNPAAEHAFGFRAADVIGTPYPLCRSDEAGLSERGRLLDACRGGPPLKAHESVSLRKDGVAVHAAMWTGPIVDVAGRLMGTFVILDVNASSIEYRGRRAILGINRDVTERHAHQQELRKRDRALAEATKLEAVGRLAGGIAHDFNNLLMVIEACSQALAEAQDDSQPVSEEVVDLEDAVARAKTLVRQLLTFARQAPVQIETLDLREVVRSLRGILRRLLSEDIELIVGVEARTPLNVQMDASQLEQVIVNLVVNARDAIAGVGTVCIDVEPSARTGFAELIVRDDGSGMAEATRAQIFEPFFTTKEPGRGTGLGLATVHGIVSACGGEVVVASQPAIGTEFRVVLPIVAHAGELEPRARARRLSQPGAESILLVEDERAVRRILARELKKYGYQVLESEDGRAALELAASHSDPIDLLVTDVVMPRMGGDELAKRLRSSRPDLKVVFMSGHMDRRAVQEIAECGGTVLPKPFPPAQLMETVRALFTGAPD